MIVSSVYYNPDFRDFFRQKPGYPENPDFITDTQAPKIAMRQIIDSCFADFLVQKNKFPEKNRMIYI